MNTTIRYEDAVCYCYLKICLGKILEMAECDLLKNFPEK